MTTRVLTALSALLAATACGEEPAPRPDAPADTTVADTVVDAAPTDTTPGDDAPGDTAGAWTAAIVSRPAADPGQHVLASVAAARHPVYDRVVWELSGMPGVRVEYVDEPVRACGSGEPVPLPGDGWLEVRLEPARAHTEEGRPTIPWRRTDPELPVVLAIARTCDFEGIVTHVLAVRSPEPFRVLALDDPPRVVVDVRRPER